MKTISSRENPLFKTLCKLSKSARERRVAGQALLDGLHLVSAYYARHGSPRLVVVRDDALEHGEIYGFLECHALQPVILSASLFNTVAPVETPTGILALVDIPSPALFSGNDSCVMLDGVQDPGNLGSILRSCAAAGVQAAFLSDQCADPWSPKVLRAGMGAHFSLTLYPHTDLPQMARRFQQEFGGKVVATVLHGDRSLYRAELTGRIAFIVGSEGAGISAELLAIAQETVTIPMPGSVESLNAAAAAAVVLFEWFRQRLQAGAG